MERLTRDNPFLSEPTNSTDAGSPDDQNAINCKYEDEPGDLPGPVFQYVQQALAANSLRAYQSDLARYRDWGGDIPATGRDLAAYLAAHAETHAPATLGRWLASLAKAHRASGLPDPTKSELVRATLRGIRRSRGTAQRQAKPLLKDDLVAALNAMGDSPKDIRDRALLLIGFAGGFRRSELVGLDVADIEQVRQGLVLNIRRSKTDQLASGRKIGIPHGRTRHCPVSAVEVWLRRSGVEEGALFRPVTRHGRVQSQRLSGEAVSLVVRERLHAAGIDPEGYAGHSLRAGLATSAAEAGVSSWKIRQQTGHASDAMLARYVRDGEMSVENAVSLLL